MKLIILGNSNSILLDGWVPAMQALMPNDLIVNLSLGGSRSPAMLYQVIDNIEQFSDTDFVIVEPTVLDCGEVAGNGNNVAGQAKALLDVLLELNVTPVVLVLPRFPRHVDDPSPGMKAWSAIASSLNIAVFDGVRVIRMMSDYLGCEKESLWRDNHGHHVSKVGKVIGEMFNGFISSFTIPQKNTLDVSLPQLPWRIVTGVDLASEGLSLRSSQTALMSVDCVVLSSGDVVDCHLTENEKIHGIAVNHGEMNPSRDVLIKIFGYGGENNANLTHNNLPAEVTHKTRVLFRAGNYSMGSGKIKLIDCAENARFSSLQDERLEISGVLVGVDIPQLSGWSPRDDSTEKTEAQSLSTLFEEVLQRRPDLFS